MIVEILTIGLLNSNLTAFEAEAYAPPPAVPRISCEITLKSWCITNFDGKISMDDSGPQRMWRLQDRLYMRGGPLIIIEDKNCTYVGETQPKVTQSAAGDGRANIVDVTLNDDDKCGIKFEYPVVNASDNSYIYKIMFGILLCRDGSCGKQLSEFFESGS